MADEHTESGRGAGADVTGTPLPAEPSAAPPIAEPAPPPPIYTAPVPPPVPPVVPPVMPPPVPSAVPAAGSGSSTRTSGAGVAIAVAAVIAFVVASFAGLAGGFLGARLASEGDLGTMPSPRRVTVVPSETDEPIVAAASVAVPSVVNVDVRGARSSGGLPGSHQGVPRSGNGSGVAFRSGPNGTTYVLTNSHVLDGAEHITVRDTTGSSASAELVGADPETDIAVLLVKRRIPAIDVTDSGSLIVGQTVVAIGSPFGLEHSVTSGVISALGRSLPSFGNNDSVYPLVDVIQTDAAINPGNSGGALVNRKGRLVGINTAIYSDTGASGGIGFAVPSNTALRVADELIEKGSVTHPFLGIVGQTLTSVAAKERGVDDGEGAIVIEITPNTGAERAGIRPNDVIIAVDGAPVRSMDDLILHVRRKRVGDTVTVTLMRNGEKRDVKVTVGEKPSGLELPSRDATRTSPQGRTE